MADEDLTPQEVVIWRAREPYTPEQGALLLQGKNPDLLDTITRRSQSLADDIRRHFNRVEPVAGSFCQRTAYDSAGGIRWVTLAMLDEYAIKYEYPSAMSTEKRGVTIRDDTLLKVIAALLANLPKRPSGKDLERAAQSVGITVSDDKIREALDLAEKMMKIIPPTRRPELPS